MVGYVKAMTSLIFSTSCNVVVVAVPLENFTKETNNPLRMCFPKRLSLYRDSYSKHRPLRRLGGRQAGRNSTPWCCNFILFSALPHYNHVRVNSSQLILLIHGCLLFEVWVAAVYTVRQDMRPGNRMRAGRLVGGKNNCYCDVADVVLIFAQPNAHTFLLRFDSSAATHSPKRNLNLICSAVS